MKRALTQRLKERFASIVENDIDTDGFNEQIESVLGRPASPDEIQEIENFVFRIAEKIKQ